ncbi:MAG: hypothetical protein IMF11_05195 [Proteobacteria bacterium]|nr:hypothetical protein [Pseudomonadota bacterium]
MTLVPLVERDEIRKAYNLFSEQLSRNGTILPRTLGWQGGNTKAEILWHENLGIWSHFDPWPDSKRYWCVFGVEDASKLNQLKITCEINPQKEGIEGNFGGLFVRDSSGKIYITHSGNLRGGKKGIGKFAFWNFFRGNQFFTIDSPNGKEYTTIIIGMLGDPKLPIQVSYYIHEVNRFKKNDVSAKPREIEYINKTFSPEFFGQRQSYRKDDIIKSQCNHGRIVNDLHNNLKNRGLLINNDRQKDLYIYDSKGMTVLFEAKTDLSTSSIYSAIGQLMYHAASQDTSPIRVLVLPGEPKPETFKILNRLDIKVLTYKLLKDKVDFSGFDTFLEEINP